MGKSQRTKGASFEREIAQIFSAALGRDFKRNIGQARDGGNDLDVGPLVIECKRRKSLKTLQAWFDQAQVAAARRPKTHDLLAIPVVVARADNGPAFIIMRVNDFLIVARDELQAYLDEPQSR